MSSTCRRGIVVVAATSSGRSSSWSRLPERRSSVRLDCSFKARRSGLREEGPRLSPHSDTEELLSCTSHSPVTRMFSSAGRQRDAVSQDKAPKCIRLQFGVCGSHPLPDFDRLSCSVRGEEEAPRNKRQPEPRNTKASLQSHRNKYKQRRTNKRPPSPPHWCAGPRAEGLAGRAERLLSAGRGEAGGRTCGSNAEMPVRTATTLCTSRPRCGEKKMYAQIEGLQGARICSHLSHTNLNYFRITTEA